MLHGSRWTCLVNFQSVFTSLIFCFFFQGEDGIRDLIVTGVQTCALPICHMGKTFPFNTGAGDEVRTRDI